MTKKLTRRIGPEEQKLIRELKLRVCDSWTVVGDPCTKCSEWVDDLLWHRDCAIAQELAQAGGRAVCVTCGAWLEEDWPYSFCSEKCAYCYYPPDGHNLMPIPEGGHEAL